MATIKFTKVTAGFMYSTGVTACVRTVHVVSMCDVCWMYVCACVMFENRYSARSYLLPVVGNTIISENYHMIY